MDADGLDVTVRRGIGRVVVDLRGELDLLTAPRLRAALAEACLEPVCDVFVELQAVTFFDALTLGLFAATAKRLRGNGCRLVLQGLSPQQDTLVRLCRLDKILTICLRDSCSAESCDSDAHLAA